MFAQTGFKNSGRASSLSSRNGGESAFSIRTVSATFLILLACILSGLRVSAKAGTPVSKGYVTLNSRAHASHFNPLILTSVQRAAGAIESAPGVAEEKDQDENRDGDNDSTGTELADCDQDSDLSDHPLHALLVQQPEVVIHHLKTRYNSLPQFGASLVLPVEIPPPKV